MRCLSSDVVCRTLFRHHNNKATLYIMCVLHIYTIMNCDDMSPEKQEQSIATEIETLGTLHIHIHIIIVPCVCPLIIDSYTVNR